MEETQAIIPNSEHHESEGKGVVNPSSSYGWLKRLGKSSIGGLEIFGFVMMIVVGAQNVGWNESYASGFWVAFIDISLSGVGYLCLCLCMAEMSSALPFSGGIYGYVRATCGPFFGYFVACFELLMNVSYVSASFEALSYLPIEAGVLSEDKQPLIVFLFYASILCITLVGGKPFWFFSSLFGLSALLIILVYVLGSVKNADFERWADQEAPTDYHVATYMFVSSVQYMGIQYIPILGHMCKEPRVQIPRMVMICIVTCIFTAIAVLVMTATHAPGTDALATEDYPLTYGFAAMFASTREKMIWLNFPGLYGSTLGFIYCYGRQISTISKTGLLPSILQETIPHLKTPYVALIMGVTICFIVNIISSFYPILINKLMKVSTLATCTVYIFACISYILFKKNFTVLQRSFYNPLREMSAVIGIGVFLLMIVSVVGYQGSHYYSFIATSGYGVCCVLFYVLYWHKHQVFSEEEKENMFKAYLINANREKRNRMKNRLMAAATGNSKGKDSSLNQASSQNKKTSNLFTNKVLPDQATNAKDNQTRTATTLPHTMNDVENTAPGYEFNHETVQSERMSVIQEVRAPEGAAHPVSTGTSVANLAAQILQFISGKSRFNQVRADNEGGSVVGDFFGAGVSGKSVLSIDQEMAILAAGGVLDDDEDAPMVFPSMAAHLHQLPAAVEAALERAVEAEEEMNEGEVEGRVLSRQNTDELA